MEILGFTVGISKNIIFSVSDTFLSNHSVLIPLSCFKMYDSFLICFQYLLFIFFYLENQMTCCIIDCAAVWSQLSADLGSPPRM